jgi:hypothetical protein
LIYFLNREKRLKRGNEGKVERKKNSRNIRRQKKTEGRNERRHRHIHLQGVVTAALQQYTTKF